MRSILHILLLLFFCSCCKESFRISGKIDKPLKSQQAELIEPDSKKGEFLLSAPLTPDGSFEIKGEIIPGKVVTLELGKDHIRLPIYLENKPYIITEKDGAYYVISTDTLARQNQYAAFLARQQHLDHEYQELGQIYCGIENVLEKARMSEELDMKAKEKNELILAGLKEFAGTEIALQILNDILYYCETDFQFFTQAIQTLGPPLPDSKLQEKINKVYEKYKAAQLTGQAPDFELPDASGKKISLSSFKGKFVLLDFWASWCAPCRKKNKVLNKHYNELTNIGLEMISISLDDNKELWLEAIKNDNIRWTQLADLSGFQASEIRKAYRVEQVPTVYLINKEGHIVSTNPEFEEILKILQP